MIETPTAGDDDTRKTVPTAQPDAEWSRVGRGLRAAAPARGSVGCGRSTSDRLGPPIRTGTQHQQAATSAHRVRTLSRSRCAITTTGEDRINFRFVSNETPVIFFDWYLRVREVKIIWFILNHHWQIKNFAHRICGNFRDFSLDFPRKPMPKFSKLTLQYCF